MSRIRSEGFDGARVARRALLALLGGSLAGCKLIDQRTFRADPPPAPPPPPPPPPVPWGPTPLATIHPRPGLELSAALRPLVLAARARKPDVAFEVAETGKDTDSILALAPAGQAVAAALLGLGVPRGRITLAMRVDAAADPGEIRLYAQ